MQVNWGVSILSPFTVTNGLKQGGVLSPYFFGVYIDELSDHLGRDELTVIFCDSDPVLIC